MLKYSARQSSAVIEYHFYSTSRQIFRLGFLLGDFTFPKSVTTAMAVGITEKPQGIITITLVVVVATGILTSVIGPTLLKWLKIDDPVAAGLALGEQVTPLELGQPSVMDGSGWCHGRLGNRCHRFALCLYQSIVAGLILS